ncbi:MAG TPA: hypothetical protein PLJ29_18120, partial [Leptospiraceae bacterium]|nr:hypothetical protein [Leptospiraceae bacterium]
DFEMLTEDHKNTYGILPERPVLRNSNYIDTEWLALRSEGQSRYWNLLLIPAVLLDAATLPYQFVLYLVFPKKMGW